MSLCDSASAADKRRRGYAFEEFLATLLAHEGLNPRLRLRPSGEEIDGSFDIDGRTHLLEAKWHGTPLPASSVYTFKGKVDGKLVGTIGVFISMSGYAEDAVDALTVGKLLNVLLFDKNDIEASIEHSLSRVLRAKLRAAAEEGIVFFPFTSTVANIGSHGTIELTDAPNDQRESITEGLEVVVICEDAVDARIIRTLAQRIFDGKSIAATVRTVVARGKQGVPRLANAIQPLLAASTPILAVLHSDDDAEAVKRSVHEEVNVPLDVIVVEPQIEAWFQPTADDPNAAVRTAAREANKPVERYLEEQSASIDLRDLAQSLPGFRALHDAFTRLSRERTHETPESGSS